MDFLLNIERYWFFMRLYLMRHAEAEPEAAVESDSKRQLTDYGQEQVRSMGSFLSNYGLQVSHLFHSGKVRAQQTAELLSQKLTLADEIQIDPGLTGENGLTPIVEKINSCKENTLFVSHLPFISRLLSRLLISDPDINLINFMPGTLVALEQVDGVRWRIKWCLNPALVMSVNKDM